MGGELIQLLRVLRLKDALTECVASRAFREMKNFAIVGEVQLHEGFWDLLWYVCKALYPMYRLLRLADMKIGGIDKVKYFMHQIDRLLPQSVVEVFEKWDSDSCPALKLKLACDSDLDYDLPKSMGGLKTTGMEIGKVLSVLCTLFSVIPHVLHFV